MDLGYLKNDGKLVCESTMSKDFDYNAPYVNNY